MRCISISVFALVSIFCYSYATTPTSVPWPVGSTVEMMSETKPLMSSYGDRANGWASFHAGIDIDENTEAVNGDYVRCVAHGYVSLMQPNGTGNGWDILVSSVLHGSTGWCYAHVVDPHYSNPENDGWVIDEEIFPGDLIQLMNVNSPETHLHFSWEDIYDIGTGLYNPLDYLTPEAEGNNYWHFNPEELPIEFKHMFLPEYWAYEWPTQYPNTDAVEADIIPDDNLYGDVDFFFGVTLQGEEETVGLDDYSMFDCAPERVYWELIREKESGPDVLSTNYVVNFDCILDHDDERSKMFTFKWLMYNLFVGNEAGFMCLTNCGDTQGWEGLGIDNIEENSWYTNKHYNQMPVEETINPILAEYPDGSYRIDVTCFAHVNDEPPNPDPPVEFAQSINCELHNFYPALREVSILDLETDQTYYHAEWVPDDLSAELNVSDDYPAAAGAELQVILIFTEEMDTGSLSAILGPVSVGNGVWSSSVVLNDTWTGEVTLPAGEMDDSYILFVSASDPDGNGLMDPEGAGTVPGGPSYDTHHELDLTFETHIEWTTILSDKVNGSPALEDIDGDGDLDISVLSADGLLYILDDNGSVMYDEIWPVDHGEWQEYLTPLTSSPALADIDANGFPDVVGVHVEGCLAIDAATGANLNDWPCYPSTSEYPAKFPGKSSPTVADVDGDGDLEVILTRHLTVPEITTLEESVFLIDHNGNCLWGRKLESNGASIISTPAVGDVSSIHAGNEIVVCTAEGFQAGKELFDEKFLYSAVYLLDPSDGSNIWKTSFNTWFFASPVVADVDKDGVNEIIIGTTFGTDQKKVIVLNGNTGALEHTWNVENWVQYSVALGDLNDDGNLDIVAVDKTGYVYCWSGSDYQSLPGFPVTVEGIPGAPAIADINSGYELEIVVGTSTGLLYAINSDGSICGGYPVDVGSDIRGCPAIGEIDGDGHLEIILVDAGTPSVYCYDLGAGTFPAEMPWRQFQHDSWHTGCFEADNTIPEPPTNLTGEITYTTSGCEVNLEWDLSVNDPNSGSPKEPTDVIVYLVMRRFSWFLQYKPIAKVNAGNNSYTDNFITGPMNPDVYYAVVAFDGTNKSVYSNIIQFPTSPSDVISLGCSVVEEFSIERASIGIPDRTEVRIMEESSEITSVHERTTETLPAVTEYAVPSCGNPYCLTDGSAEVRYTQSSGADAVVIDLGEECTVMSVIPERISEIYTDISSLTDESVLNIETALLVEPLLSIEVAGSDRVYHPFLEESRSGTDEVRYVRIHGASGLTEISVYGERESVNTVSSVEITRSVENEGWMFAIPVVEYSEEASVNIYDVSGRMIWSGHAESGSVLHWDGFTENGTAVPNGVYLLQCSIGSDVSTGSFVVMRD